MNTAQTSTSSVIEKTQRWKTIRKQLPNYLFILPHYFFFAVFLLFPIVRGLYISMFDWKIMGKTQQFIGIANYQALLKDKIFWESLGNTGQFMIMTVAINIVLALFVAAALKQSFFGSQTLRVLFYAPGILSVSVLGIIGIRIWDTKHCERHHQRSGARRRQPPDSAPPSGA